MWGRGCEGMCVQMCRYGRMWGVSGDAGRGVYAYMQMCGYVGGRWRSGNMSVHWACRCAGVSVCV